MATIQAVNILSGTPELGKYNANGDTTELWTAATTTSLANGDVITAMILPAGNYLNALQVAFTGVDSGSSFTWTAGYAAFPAAFITTSTIGRSGGGLAAVNVPLALGFVSTTDITILVTITATPGVPVAGTCRIRASYTASP